MRYPVTPAGTLEEFTSDWYIAQKFGVSTKYGFHEGADINLKTGGDTDLGQELKAIANGKIVYYHYASHPTYGFGRHLVLRVEGPWGTRWAHYAHCMEQDFINDAREVSEGQIIARLGKSGTPYAHLHFAIFKVDPVSIGGIDSIAHDIDELHNYWEDPIAFLDKWMQEPVEHPTEPITDQSKFDFGPPWGTMEMQAVRSTLNDQATTIRDLTTKIETARNALS